MDGRHVSNMEMNNRSSESSIKRQIDTIGNLRIVILYSIRENCDMQFILGWCIGNALKTTVKDECDVMFFFCVFSLKLCVGEVWFFEQLSDTQYGSSGFAQFVW